MILVGGIQSDAKILNVTWDEEAIHPSIHPSNHPPIHPSTHPPIPPSLQRFDIGSGNIEYVAFSEIVTHTVSTVAVFTMKSFDWGLGTLVIVSL